MNNPVKFEAQKIKNFQKIKFKGKIDNKNLIYLYDWIRKTGYSD